MTLEIFVQLFLINELFQMHANIFFCSVKHAEKKAAATFVET